MLDFDELKDDGYRDGQKKYNAKKRDMLVRSQEGQILLVQQL
jgi:hypothetical protein